MSPYFNVSYAFDKCSIKLMSEIIAIFAQMMLENEMPSRERWYIKFLSGGYNNTVERREKNRFRTYNLISSI